MKYRLLSQEEQKYFDEDFKYFLIANGVKNEEWLEMNQNSPKKAEELVGMFSDAVLDIVYKKMEFLEHRSKESCMVFRFKEDAIELISLTSTSEKLDLSTPESIHHALQKHAGDIQIFKTNKAYNQEREMEIHRMIESGCVPSTEGFWQALETVLDK